VPMHGREQSFPVSKNHGHPDLIPQDCERSYHIVVTNVNMKLIRSIWILDSVAEEGTGWTCR
jgi:hypothetical protein